MIISSFRTDNKSEKPVLKAAFIDADVFVGDNQLDALKDTEKQTGSYR